MFPFNIQADSVLSSSSCKSNICTMKKQNDIILAPVTSQAAEIYSLWEMNHTGRLTDFYNFMVNPSAERERFIASLETKLEFTGNFIVTNITLK